MKKREVLKPVESTYQRTFRGQTYTGSCPNSNSISTQQLIAELFQTSVPNVSMHISNVFEEGVLSPGGSPPLF